MQNKINELCEIIYKMDELIGHWFDGTSAALLSADGENVYFTADECRNRAIQILEEISKETIDR